ncbi:MAG: IS256 family transposase [Candidatus Omnitrophota bacterium]
MRTLCFNGYYTQRFARYKEFCNNQVEVVLDDFLRQFCNSWLEEEYTLQSGADWYERSGKRSDYRGGHYRRQIITARGVVKVKVPRGVLKKYSYTLFDKFKRKTEKFEDIVVDAILKGHSSRKASRFFKGMFGESTISHQAAVSTLRKFDFELEKWKNRPLRDNAVVVVLDGVYLKGVLPHRKTAAPVLFAYAVYADGYEEVLDFELTRGESEAAYNRFCQKIWYRGLKNVQLVVHDDNGGIVNTVSAVWPHALDQQCIFHMMDNMGKKLTGIKDKKKIMDGVSELYESGSEEEFYRKAQAFLNKWKIYCRHPSIKYLKRMMPETVKYFGLNKDWWGAAKTTNRLERLFEELKRRIKVFRRFPNTKSCQRWLYALLVELNKTNVDYETLLIKSQQGS